MLRQLAWEGLAVAENALQGLIAAWVVTAVFLHNSSTATASWVYGQVYCQSSIEHTAGVVLVAALQQRCELMASSCIELEGYMSNFSPWGEPMPGTLG